MSMPDDTPAAVTYLPSTTTRSPVGSAPKPRRWSRASQWRVARRPRSSPAAASSSEPVHRGGPGAGGVRRAQPVQQGRVLHVRQLPRPARHDHDVRRRHVGEGAVRDERRGSRCRYAPVRSARPRTRSPSRGAARGLVGADGVEGGEAVVEDDGDLHGVPFCRVGGCGDGRGSAGRCRRGVHSVVSLPPGRLGGPGGGGQVAGAGWKRRRYSAEEAPRVRRKARRMASGVP